MVDMKKGNGRGAIIFVVFLLVIALWIGSGVFVCYLYPEAGAAGQFGDMFGFINSLFSGLAMAGVLITIWFQREEMKQQREEMARQQKSRNTTVAWSIFDQHLKALARLQSTSEYEKALLAIINGPLCTLSMVVCGVVQDDNTEKIDEFRKELDIAIYNTDENKNVFKMLKLVDIIAKVIVKYGDVERLLVGTLFSQLSDSEVRVIIYKCIVDREYYKRSEEIGFFNYFFSHAFRNIEHARKFFSGYEFSEGFLVKKA